jgi:nicotinamide-nucleotide amidase
MAGGVLERWPAASLSVAVSGVAGPGGGSVDKPVGLVWFAWGDRRGGAVVTETDVMRFPGDRDAVRGASVLHALDGLLSRLA